MKMVGARGFEPPTPTTPLWCATRLRYAPNGECLYFRAVGIKAASLPEGGQESKRKSLDL